MAAVGRLAAFSFYENRRVYCEYTPDLFSGGALSGGAFAGCISSSGAIRSWSGLYIHAF